MSVAPGTEITATFPQSFEDAVHEGIARASETLNTITGAWVKDQEVDVKGGKVHNYRVKLKVTLVLED